MTARMPIISMRVSAEGSCQQVVPERESDRVRMVPLLVEQAGVAGAGVVVDGDGGAGEQFVNGETIHLTTAGAKAIEVGRDDGSPKRIVGHVVVHGGQDRALIGALPP